MKNIYESSFNKIEYSDKLKLLEISWLKKTESMNENQFKSEFLTNLSIAQNYNFDKLIVDESQFHFQRELHIEQWANSIINTKQLKKSNKIKMAVVYSKESLQEIAIKKIITQMDLQDVETIYFESKVDAQNWLLNGEIIPSNRQVLILYNNVFTDFSSYLDQKQVS
ncbi:hypothetical protein [Chondrinema litorale]|uniref:hypothetical protein n=1 Tax=Chondrinema litorale TaxID=2994555 RepID=UPI0025437F57|nr:hypothetical protein [Chondrinema litorale]UZR97201.1 hypothetical protein OQ292_25210 [Chondrinema litorale]